MKKYLIPTIALGAVALATFLGAESASAVEAGRTLVGLGRAGRT